MKHIFAILSITLLSLLTACQSSEPKLDNRFLVCNGPLIKNKSGNKVLLRGVNLGGWLHIEGWMDGGGKLPKSSKYVWANHNEVLSELRKRFSYEQVESLLETYQNNYIQESDFDYIASLGLNTVRIPFFWREILDENYRIKNNAFNQFDFAIKECKKRNMYIILDMHCAPGGHTGGWETGGFYDSNKLWYDTYCQEKTVEIWKAIASRYKYESTIAVYDLLNEPVSVEESELEEDVPIGATILSKVEMYDKLYKEVRKIDPNHIISMGAFFNCDALGNPKTNNWSNVIYQTHHYDDSNKTLDAQLSFSTNQLSYLHKYQSLWNVPIYAGEYSFWNFPKAWDSWLSILSSQEMPWTSWTYKNTAKNADLNWGLFHKPTVEYIDYENDSFETIRDKWANFSSNNYEKNLNLESIILNATKNKIKLPTTNFNVTSSMGVGAKRIMDNNYFGEDSRFSSNTKQVGDGSQYIEISFNSQMSFNQIEIFTENSDYSRNFKIEYLNLNSEYESIYLGPGHMGNQIISINEISTSKIKITNLANNDLWWSIYEISLFQVKQNIE